MIYICRLEKERKNLVRLYHVRRQLTGTVLTSAPASLTPSQNLHFLTSAQETTRDKRELTWGQFLHGMTPDCQQSLTLAQTSRGRRDMRQTSYTLTVSIVDHRSRVRRGVTLQGRRACLQMMTISCE